MADLDHLAANVDHWQSRGADQRALARRQWTAAEPSWGIFNVPESRARLLPAELAGLRVAELGCGTAYVSCWLARAGAHPIALDPTPGQLAIAADLQRETGVRFPLIRAAGEQVPLRDASVDLVVSEYGAAIWAEPQRWIAEAARILRPGGQLVFLGNSTLLMLCIPDDPDGVAATTLQRPQRGMGRFTWPDDPTVEFHLSPGDWIRLLRRTGFVVEDLVELYAEPGDERTYPGLATGAWGARWPVEEVWVARRLG